MNKRAFTAVELLVATGLLVMVLGIAWKLMTLFTGTKGATVDKLTRRTFLAQTSVIGLERLYNRLQEGIEILEPLPGASGTALVFRDILNHRIRLEIDPSRPNTLVSKCETQGYVIETGQGCAADESPAGGSGGGGSGPKFYPAPPIRVDSVRSVVFTPQSPVCVRINLVLGNTNVEAPVEVTLELKNHALVYQP